MVRRLVPRRRLLPHSAAELVQLPAGLVGAFLIIAGIALRHIDAASQTKTDMTIAAGAAIAYRPLAAFPFAPRFFGLAPGFSYTLYAIHSLLVFLIVTLFRKIGFPSDIPPSPAPFLEFGVTIAICLLSAFLVSLVTERKTGQIQAVMLRMYAPRTDIEASDRD